MKKIMFSILSLLTALSMSAQEKGFTIQGNVPQLPDGISVGIGLAEDSITEIATTTVKDGKFILKGKVKHPTLAMLSTNNLDMVVKNHWPDDSIHWNYIDLFLSNDDMTMTPDLKIEGGEIQKDFNIVSAHDDWRFNDSIQWDFINKNPQSVISVFFVNNMLKRGYGLTTDEVERLSKAITGVPGDTLRYAEYRWRVEYARKSTIGSPLIDLEIKTPEGKVTHLVDVVPQGKFVLVDFWASWCGQCIAAFPELEKIARKYKREDFEIVDLSIDTKEPAWKNAMKRHPQPWEQYCTTQQGYKDLFTKYQIGNGVPYFVMVTPDGKVLKSPQTVEEIDELLKFYIKK